MIVFTNLQALKDSYYHFDFVHLLYINVDSTYQLNRSSNRLMV